MPLASLHSRVVEYSALGAPDDDALARRWLSFLPGDDRALLEQDSSIDHAGAAREAVGDPSGYLADAALAFRPSEFRVEDVGCPVSLWYGEHDANAPCATATGFVTICSARRCTRCRESATSAPC